MSEQGISESLRETLTVFHAEQPGVPLTTSEVGKHFDASHRSVSDRLWKLAEMDRLRTKAVGPKGRIWWCPPGERESRPLEPGSDGVEQGVGGECEPDPIPPAAFLESVLDTESAIVYLATIDGRLLRWNDRLESVTGYDGGELAAMTPMELIAEPARERVENTVARVSDRGNVTVEAPLLRSDGETMAYELSVTAPRDAAGEPIGVTVIGRDVSERKRAGREELERELAALMGLSEVVRDIGDAVIEQSTRAEIESVVCERLAASDSYDFAWFGRADSPTKAVTLTAEAGVENYLDGNAITVAPGDERSDGPTGRAFRTGEIQTWRDGESDARYDPWLEQAEAYGFRASAAIPITYQGTTYGVLNVYTERSAAFTDRERTVLDQLGAIVAHAIAAIERKRALMTDEIVELRFHVPDFMSGLDLDSVDGRIEIADTVPKSGDEYVVYGTTTGEAAEWIDEIADSRNHWDRVEYRESESDDPERFELHLDQPPLVSAVASVGGAIVDAEIENGQYYLTVQTPPGAGVREVIDTVRDAYPAAEMLSRTQTTRDTGITGRTVLDITDELTDRQLAVLRAAYQSGFFEWPRDASGEDVAESLDIAAPTFHQHLRKAEKAVFAAVLSTTTS